MLKHLLSLAFVLGIAILPAQVTLTFDLVPGIYSEPTDIVNAADSSNRLFIVEKGGRVKVLDLNTNEVQADNFLNIVGQISTNSERGLLSLAFHPDFASNGEFFVHYSASGGQGIPQGDGVISRYTMTDPTASTALGATEEVLLTVVQDFSNHNGGKIAFGPDSLLYIGLGDGGSGGDPNNRGQDPFNLLGTLLRIDVDNAPGQLPYGIPADNPFADAVEGLPEIFAYGLRNPWKFSFDALTNDLWIGDVGQNAREEINFVEAANGNGLGFNYGWDCREGNIAFSNSSPACDPSITYVDPIVDFSHNSPTMAASSITGGYVYRGTEWPELYGTYICADFATSNFFSIVADDLGAWDVFTQSESPASGISSFGESEDGELYVASYFNGRIYKIGGGVSDTRQYFKAADFTVSVSPNPANRILRVDLGELSSDQLLKVSLVDITGRPVLNQTWSLGAGPQAKDIHLPVLPAGTYQLLVRGQGGAKAVPVVILPK